MKKSNVIIFALLAVVSAFLLWLWYYLGLNRVDEPLDLVLSIVWWVVIVAAIAIIAKMEQTRRRRIRTVYVGDTSLFNSEKGMVDLQAAVPMKDFVASLLDDLKYDFTREDFPDKDDFDVKYFIRSKEFKAEKQDDQQNGAQATGQGATSMPAGQGTATGASQATAPIAAAVVQGGAAGQATQPLSAVGSTTDEPEQKKWKGEVVVVDTQEEHPFDTPEELADILTKLQQDPLAA